MSQRLSILSWYRSIRYQNIRNLISGENMCINNLTKVVLTEFYTGDIKNDFHYIPTFRTYTVYVFFFISPFEPVQKGGGVSEKD